MKWRDAAPVVGLLSACAVCCAPLIVAGLTTIAGLAAARWISLAAGTLIAVAGLMMWIRARRRRSKSNMSCSADCACHSMEGKHP